MSSQEKKDSKQWMDIESLNESREFYGNNVQNITQQQFKVKENLFENEKIQQKNKKEEPKKQLTYKKGDNIKDYAKEMQIEVEQQKYFSGLRKHQYKYRQQNEKLVSIYPDILQQHICPICMSKFKDNDDTLYNNKIKYENQMKITKECGHNFCQICIDKLSDKCPICQKTIDISQSVHNRIFLNKCFEENDFLCPNCNYPFDNDLRKPIILTNCGHTYCLYCVENNERNRKIYCVIDKTETDLLKQNVFENRLLRDDIEKKLKEDLKKVEDSDDGNVYYCLRHYVPIKKSNFYHLDCSNFILHNDDVDFFLSAFRKEYDVQEKQIKNTFNDLGDLGYENLDSKYTLLKKSIIDARIDFKHLNQDLTFIDNQQHLQNLSQFLDQHYVNEQILELYKGNINNKRKK